MGKPTAGVRMACEVGRVRAHAGMTRPLAAGAMICSGTVSNRDAEGVPGRPIADGGLGYSCVAELRAVETIRVGKPQTPFLRFGSQVRIEMRDGEGQSLFGAIEQAVKSPS